MLLLGDGERGVEFFDCGSDKGGGRGDKQAVYGYLSVDRKIAPVWQRSRWAQMPLFSL